MWSDYLDPCCFCWKANVDFALLCLQVRVSFHPARSVAITHALKWHPVQVLEVSGIPGRKMYACLVLLPQSFRKFYGLPWYQNCASIVFIVWPLVVVKIDGGWTIDDGRWHERDKLESTSTLIFPPTISIYIKERKYIPSLCFGALKHHGYFNTGCQPLESY